MTIDPNHPAIRGLSLRETARLIGRSVAWLYKKSNRDALMARGFPPPLPLPGRLSWDAPAVHRWLDQQMPSALRPRADEPVDQWAATLDRRAAKLAADQKDHAA